MKVRDLLFSCANLRWASIVQIYGRIPADSLPTLVHQESYCSYILGNKDTDLCMYNHSKVDTFEVTKDGIKIWI